MDTLYIYRIFSNIKGVCNTTISKAYQFNYVIDHIDVGSSFVVFVGAQLEHDMEIATFENEEDENEDNEFTKQLTKYNINWQLVERLTCKFCNKMIFDRALYGDIWLPNLKNQLALIEII